MENRYILDILHEYDTIRNNNIREQADRQKMIYAKFPRIKEIDSEINKKGIEIASSVFKNVDIEKVIAEKKKEMLDLKMEKGEILSANKYPIDYLEIKYKCNKCKDTGYIGANRCNCFKQKLIERLYQQSNLKGILSKQNFDNFNFNLYSDEMPGVNGISPRQNIENIYRYSINYIKNFNNEDKGLYFYGNSGLGKTFLANCIAKALLDKTKTVIYFTSSSFIDLMHSIRYSDALKENANDIIQNIMSCDLLIIDDLGTESANTFSYSEIFNVINTRMLNNKKMLISTNFTVEDLLDKYPERITSRIFGGFTMFKFFGEDIRLKIRQK